jgi:hypothetical protein
MYSGIVEENNKGFKMSFLSENFFENFMKYQWFHIQIIGKEKTDE